MGSTEAACEHGCKALVDSLPSMKADAGCVCELAVLGKGRSGGMSVMAVHGVCVLRDSLLYRGGLASGIRRGIRFLSRPRNRKRKRREKNKRLSRAQISLSHK